MENFNNYIISKQKLLDNVRKIKRHIGLKTKLCAVVKADAYGLGVKNVCESISNEVDFYAVVSVYEAKEIRVFDDKDILILGASNLEYVDWCADNNVTISISTLDEVKYINKFAKGIVKAHLKINSGMNRYGIKDVVKLKEILREIKLGGKILITGVYTHFATKAEDRDFIEKQYQFFINMVGHINIPNLIIHCSNSYVSLNDKRKICNMIRVGFSLYSDYYDKLNIENVLSIKARVTAINTLQKGESVGYDRTYIASKSTKIAVVSMGYADGFSRNLSNNFKVLIGDQFVPVVGRVCMDCFMVDVTDIKNVFVGSEVTILGRDVKNEITLSDYADALNFSPYEVLVNFRRRRTNVIVK